VQTIHPTTARPKSPTRRRRLVVAACAAVVLLAGLGVKLWLDHRAPPPDADAGRLSRYMASSAFAALPDAQKAPYLDAFQHANDRGELTREQQRGVISNVINPSGKNPIQQYFSLPPGNEREKFLDDVIDRVLKEDKHHPPPDKKGAKEIQIDRGRLADSIAPEDRAGMDQFLQDLHDRRMARGLSDDGKFLFNRTH
jgi:hypothetical protein